VVFFVEDDVLFFAEPLFAVLFVARGPLARVLAALLREAALVPSDAMVLAAWVLAEALGFLAVEEALRLAVLFFAAGEDFVLLAVPRALLALPLFEAVPRGPLAKALAALLFAEALPLSLAKVLAALVLPEVPVDLLVGICVSLL